jgi:hypothetical protein
VLEVEQDPPDGGAPPPPPPLPEATTGAVAADVADAEPTLFVAVTVVRKVNPTSAETGTYVAAIAPLSVVQLAPLVLQRCQRYEYVMGVAPVQVPFVVVRVEPTCGVPKISGRAVLTGAVEPPPSGVSEPPPPPEHDAVVLESRVIGEAWPPPRYVRTPKL